MVYYKADDIGNKNILFMEAVSMQEAYSSTLKTKHFWYYQKQDAGRIECNILDMCLGIFTFIWTTYMQEENRIEIVYKIPVSDAQVLAQVLMQAGRVIPWHQQISHAFPN